MALDGEPADVWQRYLEELGRDDRLGQVLQVVRDELGIGKPIVIERIGTRQESRMPWSEARMSGKGEGRMLSSDPFTHREALGLLHRALFRTVVDSSRIVLELADAESGLMPQGFFFESPPPSFATELAADEWEEESREPTESVLLRRPSGTDRQGLERLETLLRDLQEALDE